MARRAVATAAAAALLAGVGVAGGWAAAALGDDGPAAITTLQPLPADPSVPGDVEEPYAPDIDYPVLAPDLPHRRHVLGSAPFAWSYVAPTGWDSRVIGPAETTWVPPGSPEGAYGLRVKIVSERITPAAMVAQKIDDLGEAVDGLEVVGRTSDTLAVTFRTTSDRLRYNTFRWFTRPGGSEAQLEVSVSGRSADLPGLDDLLDQVAASARPARDDEVTDPSSPPG